MADELPTLPEDWGVYQTTTRAKFERLRRRNWYVRMADGYGLVPHPSQSTGVAALMVALEPEVFPTMRTAHHWHRRRPWHAVEEHWGTKVQPVLARLPGTTLWLSLLVHSPTIGTALKRAAKALPEETEIKETDE